MSETLENGGYKFIRARKDDEKKSGNLNPYLKTRIFAYEILISSQENLWKSKFILVW